LAEDQDLRVLGDGVHVVDVQELDDATDEAVEAERHGVAASPFQSWLVKGEHVSWIRGWSRGNTFLDP
jgi:hypothetical protein